MASSGTLLWMLVVSACCLAASAAGPPAVATTTDSSLTSSTVGDSTLTHQERGNLFVHPYYRTSPEPNTTDGQPSHGEGSNVADTRPLPARSPPPRRQRTRFGIRRPSLAKGLYPHFQVYSANAGHGTPQGEPSGHDPKMASQDKDQYSKSEKGFHSSGTHESKDLISSPQPARPELRVNETLVAATNGTADEDTSSVTTMVLSETTIWTLALCATMIIAAVAFFAVVLAVCRCRQQRERRKRYLNTHKNIRVMQNMVKIAKRREKQTTVSQGPFSRISIP